MNGWLIGFAVGAAVVVIVVVLLLTLITLARRIAGRAESILAALQAAAENTTSLSSLTETTRIVNRINAGATTARDALEGTSS